MKNVPCYIRYMLAYNVFHLFSTKTPKNAAMKRHVRARHKNAGGYSFEPFVICKNSLADPGGQSQKFAGQNVVEPLPLKTGLKNSVSVFKWRGKRTFSPANV